LRWHPEWDFLKLSRFGICLAYNQRYSSRSGGKRRMILPFRQSNEVIRLSGVRPGAGSQANSFFFGSDYPIRY
jgi:hypothetical protein